MTLSVRTTAGTRIARNRVMMACFGRGRVARKGFTLLDIVVGITLSAIISLFAVPALSSFLSRYQLITTANQLGFEITRARMQAVGQNMYVRVRMLDGQRYVRERSTDGAIYMQDGPVMALPSGMTGSTGVGGAPSFNRSGMANLTTTINLANGSGYKTVSTSILGRVTIS